MQNPGFWALPLMGLLTVPALADKRPDPSSPVTVADLLVQLSSKDFHTRESASKSLSALGVDVLPALQKAKANADPEVRRRLEELIPPLERAVALMPKRVTLHLNHKPLRTVLAEFTKQTGYKLATWPDPQ